MNGYNKSNFSRTTSHVMTLKLEDSSQRQTQICYQLSVTNYPLPRATCEKNTAYKEEGLPLFGKNYACEKYKK